MLRLPLLIQSAPKDLIAAPISAFESETQAVIVKTSPYSEHAILHVLIVIFVLSFGLMGVVKLDRVVASTGKLIPTQGELYVQPFDRAVVRRIMVHTGDIVKAGQVLAELDPTFAQADVKQLTEHAATLSAQVARLEAELAGIAYQGGETAAEQLQLSLWHQRQSELQQTTADFDARIRSAGATILRSQQDLQAYTKRLDYAKQYTAMQETLERDGNTSKVKVLSAHDAEAEAGRQVTEARNMLDSSQHEAAALTAQRAVALGKWHDDIATQLATSRDDLQQTQQSLAKAKRIGELVTLEAPQDAVVLDIASSASSGSVVDSNAKPLFTLVPLNGPIEAELHIPGGEIGFIKVGDPVQLKLDAYSFLRHGTAQGTITTISEGSFTEDEGGLRQGAYFKARVRVTDLASLRDVPKDFRLIPGMGLQGDVMVGHRTILSYLLSGAMRASSEAMREP